MQIAEPSAERVSVALYEDHALLRESMTAGLRPFAVDVIFGSADLSGFLAGLQQVQPRAVIVDLTIHGGPDGHAAVAEVTHRYPSMPVLVLSTSMAVADVERAMREGAAGYLFKLDSTCESVAAAVHGVVRGQRIFPADVMLARALSPAPTPVPDAPHPGSAATRLTEREREVLSLVASGHDNLKISALLQIGERTVKAHVASLYRKLHVENRVQLAIRGRELGLGSARAN